MPITGVHALLYTPQAEALRATMRDVFAEMGIHPSEGTTQHAISFMCDDIEETVAELKQHGIEFSSEPRDAGFGIEATMVLPGGVEVSLYEPRHTTAI